MSDLPAHSSAPLRTWFPAAPIGTACGLAVATAYVGVVDPAQGSLVPPCPFRALTGWWCPGCGMTRATHHLLQGDVVGALRFNLLLPFVLTLIAIAWLDWYGRTIGRRYTLEGRAPRWATTAAIGVAVAFGVLRNLPGVDFLPG